MLAKMWTSVSKSFTSHFDRESRKVSADLHLIFHNHNDIKPGDLTSRTLASFMWLSV
jgi:hypothetical protein